MIALKLEYVSTVPTKLCQRVSSIDVSSWITCFIFKENLNCIYFVQDGTNNEQYAAFKT